MLRRRSTTPVPPRQGSGMPASMRLRRTLRVAGRVLLVLLLCLVVALNVAAVRLGDTLDSFLSNDTVDVSDEDVRQRRELGEQLAREVEGQGIVLLRNEGDALPLEPDVDKVSVFGWSSTQWISGGSGSGGVAGDTLSLLDALEDAGISYDEGLAQMYRDFQGERPYLGSGTLNTSDEEFCRLYEPDIDDDRYYTQELLDGARSYADTALVVLGRIAGESIDCPRVQYRVSDSSGEVQVDETRAYLELSPEEERLLAYVGSTYDRVVVIVNSTNAMELGQLETTPGVGAALLVGATGTSGARAVVDVLTGSTNPSGRTTDTFAYELSSAPSYVNAGADGEGSYTNAAGMYPADGTVNVNVGTSQPYDAVRYVDYAEGIYVGYRWYETADAEGFWDEVDNEHGTGYDGAVQYPFGYGLSYTGFSWEVIDLSPSRRADLERDSELSWTVRVTNTGEVSGRDVVELYCTPPYEEGGVEKAATELVGFAKTRLLEPGESQDVIISVLADDLASYDGEDGDEDGFSGYELEAGEYVFELKTDAHTVATCDGARTSYRVRATIPCATDLVTGAEVRNRFSGSDATDGISIDGSNTGQGIVYLSRADFEGTYPQGVRSRVMSEALRQTNLYDATDPDDAGATGEGSGVGEDGSYGDLSQVVVSRDGSLTEAGQRLGMDYDDALWDGLVASVSQEEKERLFLHGYCTSAAVDSVGKARTKELDGPSQIGSFHQLSYGEGYPNPTVLAQTWSVELAHTLGQQVGMEAANLGIDGWYAPSTNLHRTPLGGRNYEYYAEDPLLAGSICSEVQLGSREAGTFCYTKHLALNNQDSYRDGLYTWLTEQTLRELYLRPFRMTVEQGGATGFMSSYNRIGATWAGGSRALLTDVLRGEWGFRGSVITDYCDHKQYMSADQALLAGGDLYMDGVFRDGSLEGDAASAAYRAALDRSAKDVIYIWLEARSHNLAYNAAAEATGAERLSRPIVHQGVSYVTLGLAAIDALALMGAVAWCVRRIRGRGRRTAPGATPNEP